MGREIKRVALDFDWPIGKVWTLYFLITCIENCSTDTCNDCKTAAKMKGMKVTSSGCPEAERHDPPSGNGFQLWDTTFGGSPMSPVFESADQLATWLTANKIGSCDDICSHEEWIEFILGPGWTSSAVEGCEINK